MQSYRVVWEIDLDAETPIDAARLALEIQRDPNSLATEFSVLDAQHNQVQIDLGSLGE